MEFEQLLKQKTEEINCILEQYLPERMEKEGIIQEAMRYSVKAGGKRLRPMILLEVCRLFTEDTRVLKTAACFATALEMVHTYSLVHDDLPAMDNDEYRRGMLTTHAKYGEAFGILAGDALLNEAFYICSKETEMLVDESYMNPSVLPLAGAAVKAQRILAECAGKDGMIKGQEIDLSSEGKAADSALLMQMYELKTSRLLEAAFTIGAVLGGCTAEQQDSAYNAASALGRAFQLRDDILDLIGDEKKLGKPVKSDVRNDKSTYVSLEGFEKTEAEIMRLTQAAVECMESLPGDISFMRQLMLFLIQRDY